MVKLRTFYPTDGQLRLITICNNNLLSVPFELNTLHMGMISVLLVIETAPSNFLLTYIEKSKCLGSLLEYPGRYRKSLNCFEESFILCTLRNTPISSLYQNSLINSYRNSWKLFAPSCGQSLTSILAAHRTRLCLPLPPGS